MFLSRVEVAINDRRKLKDLTTLGGYHRWIEESFPDEIDQGLRLRHLWRLDPLRGREYLLLVSENAPDLECLAKYGVPGTVESKDYAPFLGRLSAGMQARFRLTANPTYVQPLPDQRGRVLAHVTVEQQRQWLVAHAEKAGFELLEGAGGAAAFDIVARDRPILKRKGNVSIRLSRVTYEGRLRIADEAQFKEMLVKGLGREKAFGMGLMTVIPEG